MHQFYQDDVNRFGEANYSLPPSCLVSVYGSPNAVPSLHYSVPLVGVVRPVTLYIHRSLKTPPSSSMLLTVAYNVLHQITIDATCVADEAAKYKSQGTKRSRELGIEMLVHAMILIAHFLQLVFLNVDFDVKNAKQKVKDVLTKHQVDLTHVCQYSYTAIANELLQVGIITHDVQKSPTYDSMIGSFLSGMRLRSTQSELEEHCVKFLKALSNVGGPVADAAVMIKEKWILAIEGKLQFDYSGKRTKN